MSVATDQIDSIRQACLLADGTDPLDEATSLRLKNHGIAEADHLWVEGADGFALALTEAATPPRIDLSLAVRPSARRRGIASILLADCLALPSYAEAEWFAWSHGDHPAARRLATAHHFVSIRELWVLRLAVEGSRQARPAENARPTDEFTIRSYQPSDASDLIAVNAAAFASHPEQGAMDTTNLMQRMAEPWFDPQGLLVATNKSGTLVGFHWTKLHPRPDPTTPQIGEVYVIGVSPAAHGQGLGRQLMQAGLHHLVDRGVDEVLLYVEADNAPALALYHSLGFTHHDQDTHVLFHRHARQQVRAPS